MATEELFPLPASFLRRQLGYEEETHRGQHRPGSDAPDPTGASVSYSIGLVGFRQGAPKGQESLHREKPRAMASHQVFIVP